MKNFLKKILVFTFFLIAINNCAQLPDFANKFLGISSENDKKIDLCNDLHEHIANLKIDASSYSGKDEEFPNNDDSIGMTDQDGQPIKLVWTKMEEIAKKAKKKFTIFGTDIQAQDIRQGALGDCYFLAAISGLANNDPNYIRSIFDEQTKEEKKKGIITTNWLINGRQVKVSIDSYIPTTKDKQLLFANFFFKIQGDFEFWPIILEKAWAKIYGSYGAIEGGQSNTVYKSLSMSPVFSYTHSKIELEELWQILNTHLSQKMPVSACTGQSNMFNLVPTHAYSPLSTCEYALDNGEVLRLVKIKNPWAVERYTGPFRDNDPNWTDDMRKQCGSKIENDGLFHIPIADYQNAFTETSGAIVIQGYTSEYLISEELSSDFKEREDCYQIIVSPTQTSTSIWVQINFLDQRFNEQLPEECSIKQDYFSLVILSENFEVVEKVYDDSDPLSFQKELKGEEKYYVFVKSKIKTKVLKDYVVDVYAPKGSVQLSKEKVNRNMLYLENLKVNKEKGTKQELEQGSNIWMYYNVPISNDQNSWGIIFDNQNPHQKLQLSLTITVKRMDIIAEGCQVIEENENTEERVFKCEGTLHHQQIYPILFMHQNSYNSYSGQFSYNYEILHDDAGNTCFDYEVNSQGSDSEAWTIEDQNNISYGCDWFNVNPTFKCKNYGEFAGKGGKSANEVCCSCGGGSNEKLALVVGKSKKKQKKKQHAIAIGAPETNEVFHGMLEKVSGIIYKKSK